MNEDRQNSVSMMNGASSEGVIKLRLDTTDLITKMELFLKGKKYVTYVDDNGEQYVNIEKVGEPLMNDTGIQAVLMTLNQTVSSQGVQGNWSIGYFERYVEEVDVNFSSDLMTNLNKWDIKLENYNVICNAFMNLVQQFTSRIIDNKERESYGLSMRTNESVVQSNSRTNSLFGG